MDVKSDGVQIQGLFIAYGLIRGRKMGSEPLQTLQYIYIYLIRNKRREQVPFARKTQPCSGSNKMLNEMPKKLKGGPSRSRFQLLRGAATKTGGETLGFLALFNN